MDTTIIIIVLIYVLLFDYIPLLKKGEKKDKWIYSVILIISAALLLTISFGVQIPSPTKPIDDLIRRITGI